MGVKDKMDNEEMKEGGVQQNRVDFWGEKNEDKQDISMDWSHDAHFWIALSAEEVGEVIAMVRQLLSAKFGTDWPDRPSPRARGRYVGVIYNHHFFADFNRKGVKEYFAEVHPADTGNTIFVRFWHDLFEEAKAAFQEQGFHYHSQIPDKYQVKIPGKEISPEKAAALEKFRTSQPLTIPEGKFERKKSSAGTLVGVVVILIMVAGALVLLRGQLFKKEEPLALGNFLAVESNIAAFEKMDGSIVYALSDATLENILEARVLVYGDLIDSSRADFYAAHKLTSPDGVILYQAAEGTVISIPSFVEDQELAKYQAIDAGAFRYDRKKDWEGFQGEPVALKGSLKVEADGLYLEAGDGLIKLVTRDSFTLLNLEVAQKKAKPVTLYGTIGETFDWKTERKQTHKMFRFSVDPVSYAALTAS